VSDLADRSIVLTRNQGAVDPLGDALRAAGATVHYVALTEFLDATDDGASIAAATDRVEAARWLVVTSKHAAELLVNYPALLQGPRIAAVGEATASALRDEGISVDLVGPGTGGADLAELIIETGVGGPVIFFGAQDPATGLGRGLRNAGIELIEAFAYRTVPAAPDESGLRAIENADLVLVTSPKAGTALAQIASIPQGVVAIGPSTAEQLVRESVALAGQAKSAEPADVLVALRLALG
jgi:uroporphyrinogen-III synthase